MSSDWRLRACAIALRTYPRGARAERGAEIMGALADAADDGHAAGARELAALVAGSVRAHGLAVLGGDRSSRATWQAGARLAALILLLLAGIWNAFDLAAFGVYEPLQLGAWGGIVPVPAWPTTTAWAHLIAAAALPLAGAVLLCLGRGRLATAASIAWLAAVLAGRVGIGWGAGSADLLRGAPDTPVARAATLAAAVAVVTPALLLLLAGAWRPARSPRHGPGCLAVVPVLVVLHVWFWSTTLLFWPLGALLVALFLLAPLDVRLPIAALGVSVPVLGLVTATALQSPEFAYAPPVAVGLVCLAVASTATALARRTPGDRQPG